MERIFQINRVAFTKARRHPREYSSRRKSHEGSCNISVKGTLWRAVVEESDVRQGLFLVWVWVYIRMYYSGVQLVLNSLPSLGCSSGSVMLPPPHPLPQSSGDGTTGPSCASAEANPDLIVI